jgi:hypothetical protein
MASVTVRPPSGHVYRIERKRGPVWFAKYRLPDGRQVQKKIGPAWTERGRPAAGYFTKRTAEDWLRERLDEARRGTLPGMVRTGASFADAAAEWLRYLEQDRRRKPSTVAGYRSIVRSELLTTRRSNRPVPSDGLKATIAATASPYGLGLTTTVALPSAHPEGSILNRRVVHFSTGVDGPVFNRP